MGKAGKYTTNQTTDTNIYYKQKMDDYHADKMIM